MVDMMFDREQKKLVKYLVASLKPASFKKEILRRIDQEQNKRYKVNVIEFSRWLTTLLASSMVWEKSIISSVEGNKPRQQASGKHAATHSTGSHLGNGSAKSSGTGNKATEDKEPTKKKRRWPCLKCTSTDHLVKD
ncbi:hypothetical protein V7S43_007601 [Phytophthora oleae]|uniref:CCHC-type domain-containing protein n=1 Tax=Phytophthora oleae TaxID=2107226 RepID=A0ABD3FP20_9STRA